MHTIRKAALAASATAALVVGLSAPGAAAQASTAKTADGSGKVVVFTTEGAQLSLTGTKLDRFDASTKCQAFPTGAHVIDNLSTKRLRLYTDPSCLFPAPPPFNFIQPGYGAHVTPTGSFRVG